MIIVAADEYLVTEPLLIPLLWLNKPTMTSLFFCFFLTQPFNLSKDFKPQRGYPC